MTGATGDLTPDDLQRDFEPGELREISHPTHHADVTQALAQAGETDEPANQADAYGSEHSGGDDVTDHEEHF